MRVKIIERDANICEEIKKSKFIAYCYGVQSAAEAEDNLAKLRKEHKDARHICYALRLTNTAKMSDDGEPQGTAGKPMYEILTKRELVNCLVAVVRYFGGIKLGAGGLTRAYAGACTKVLDAAGTSVFEQTQTLSFSVPLALGKNLYLLERINGVKQVKANYSAESVNVVVVASCSKVEDIKKEIGNLLNLEVK